MTKSHVKTRDGSRISSIRRAESQLSLSGWPARNVAGTLVSTTSFEVHAPLAV